MIEESEQKDDTLTTLRADLIPGLKDILKELNSNGIRCGLVADTRPGTYKNVLLQHGIYEIFDVFSISEELGIEKPHPKMFEYALEKLGVEKNNSNTALMVGNNYERDVVGAKSYGLSTLWFHWNNRYEVPINPKHADYICRTPAELRTTILTWLKINESISETVDMGERL